MKKTDSPNSDMCGIVNIHNIDNVQHILVEPTKHQRARETSVQ